MPYTLTYKISSARNYYSEGSEFLPRGLGILKMSAYKDLHG